MSKDRNPAIIAALWMVGTLVSFSSMAVAGRELSETLGTFQILFFRSVVGLLILSVIIQRKGWVIVSTTQFTTHFVRNIAHFGGQFGWFYGLALIPLADVFAIEFTVPVWTTLFAVILLRERLSVARIIAVAFGVLGMMIILRPGITVIQPASIAVLLSAICYGFAYINTKKLLRDDAPLSILFYMTIIQLPLGLVPALYDWHTPSIAEWPLIIIVAVTALSAHYCISRAMQLVDASVVVPMDFMRLPLIAVVGFVFYGESLEWAVLAGGTVMFLGNYMSIRAEKRAQSLKLN